MIEFSSRLLEQAVEQIAKLPGIGKKTALRLALHLVREHPAYTSQLTDSLNRLRSEVMLCKTCHNISDDEECPLCKSPRRDKSLVCVVEDMRDVMAIENTAQYQGLYHVLGGVISPVNGIGPGDLKIESLINRVMGPESQVKEVILAFSSTMEGDTTGFFIQKKLSGSNVKITSIARGIPVGGDLEFTDELTLGRSIVSRTLLQ
jgi:recombination protein RecR